MHNSEVLSSCPRAVGTFFQDVSDSLFHGVEFVDLLVRLRP